MPASKITLWMLLLVTMLLVLMTLLLLVTQLLVIVLSCVDNCQTNPDTCGEGSEYSATNKTNQWRRQQQRGRAVGRATKLT